MEGSRLGAYELVELIGSGAMGSVYRAVTRSRVAGMDEGREVAVKLIKPELISQGGYFKRFLREAELGRTVNHPHVVRTLDVDAAEFDGMLRHYLVMELVEGRTLEEVFAESGCLDEAAARALAAEVLAGLQAIHASGAVHRDIKPSNLLVGAAGTVKVMDLGIAQLRAGTSRLTETGRFVGTLLYSAPEQLDGNRTEPDPRIDLYALGLVLFRALTGVHPFYSGDLPAAFRKQLIERAPSISCLRPEVSPFFDRFISCLLEPSPDRRFPTAAAAAAALKEGEEGSWWSEGEGPGTPSGDLDLPGFGKALAWPFRGDRALEFLGGLLLVGLSLVCGWSVGSLPIVGIPLRAAMATAVGVCLFRYLDDVVRATWRRDLEAPRWPDPRRFFPVRRSDASALLVLLLAAAPAVIVAAFGPERYLVLLAAAAGATLLPAAILRHAGTGGFRAADPVEMLRILGASGQPYLLLVAPIWLALALRFLMAGEGVTEPLSESLLVFSLLLSAHLAGRLSRVRKPLRRRLVPGRDGGGSS